MKNLITIIILSLCFITSSHTDDLKEFQIEGISIGDKLSSHFSESIIKKGRKYKYKNPDYVSIEFREVDLEQGFLKFYDNIIITINNLNIIEGVGGLNLYKDGNIDKCKKEQLKVKSELTKLFPEKEFISNEHKSNYDKTGKSIIYNDALNFYDHGIITIQCYDWNNKKIDFVDNLRVTISTNALEEFLNYKAY
jgi:hypothetical protein